MENILRFEETTFKKSQEDWESFDGYVITTNKQSIKIGISNGQDCCESFGYFSSADSLEDFVGATIMNISITDTELQTGLANKHDAEYLDEGGIMFVNIETNRGIVQFAAYNSHNGFYGHEALYRNSSPTRKIFRRNIYARYHTQAIHSTYQGKERVRLAQGQCG